MNAQFVLHDSSSRSILRRVQSTRAGAKGDDHALRVVRRATASSVCDGSGTILAQTTIWYAVLPNHIGRKKGLRKPLDRPKRKGSNVLQ